MFVVLLMQAVGRLNKVSSRLQKSVAKGYKVEA